MTDVSVPAAATGSDGHHDVSVELSSRRTGMSFQRTRMSADRTLMSVIRTALSLISFGFTIFQFFGRLQEQRVLSASRAPRNFGLTLIYLGVAMLLAGIAFHVQFMLGLRHQRSEMAEENLIHAKSHFPASFTLMVAILLLFVGIAALVSLAFGVGPFR